MIFLTFVLMVGIPALLLAAFDHFKKVVPEPKHSEVYPMLPCQNTAILTAFGPGAANTISEMEWLGLVTNHQGYIAITRLGEEVMK